MSSYTRLRYHLVTTTKHRTPFLQPDLEKFVYNAICRRVDDLGAKVIELNGVIDHFHLVAAIPPTIALSDFMREIKTASTRSVHKGFPGLQLFEWQRGFGAFTLDPEHLQPVLDYVRQQKEHHAKNHLWTPYEMTTKE